MHNMYLAYMCPINYESLAYDSLERKQYTLNRLFRSQVSTIQKICVTNPILIINFNDPLGKSEMKTVQYLLDNELHVLSLSDKINNVFIL